MAEAIRSCPDHDYFTSTACPHCGQSGEEVLSGARRRRLSTYLSGALRHFPDDAGLDLDRRGWAPLEAVIESVESNYDWAHREHVVAVVTTDPKGRFERDRQDGREVVRAAYGHSVTVDLDSGDGSVPEKLYHGTAPGNVPSIRDDGLKPMGRQHVHLSGTVEDAHEVGSRHADDPVILEVDATAMETDGHEITKRGCETYTTERVPPAYIDRLDSGR